MVPLRLNSELVMEEWVRSIPDLANNGVGVAGQLPLDNTTWAASGFVVVNVLEGNEDIYLPVGRPVIQLEAFAVKPNTGRPIWRVTSNILYAIVAATRDEDTIRRELTIAPGGVAYPSARVMEAYPVGSVRRLYKPASDLRLSYGDDQGQYARMALDLQAHWTEA